MIRRLLQLIVLALWAWAAMEVRETAIAIRLTFQRIEDAVCGRS